MVTSQVVPLLSHDDPAVVTLAARYLADAPDALAQSAALLWQSIGRFGKHDAIPMLGTMLTLPQDASTLRRAIEALRRMGEDDYERFHLRDVLARANFALLESDGGRLLNDPDVPADIAAHWRARLELRDASFARLWTMLTEDAAALDAHLQRLALQDDGLKSAAMLDDFDYRRAERVVEALARHPVEAGAAALDVMRRMPRDSRLNHAVEVAGAVRYAPATDALLDCVVADINEYGDELAEQASDALVRIGGANVVRGIEAHYASADRGARMSLTELLGRIKLPESEGALLRLLDRERNPEPLTDLVLALRALCTTEGIDRVRRIVLDRHYDITMAWLEEDLLTLCKATGYELPPVEAEELRRRIEDVEGRKEQTRQAHHEQMRRWELESRDALDEDDGGFDDPDAPLGETWDGHVAAPYRRESPKVGRNDPCPCGSGKKFKKCCLPHTRGLVEGLGL